LAGEKIMFFENFHDKIGEFDQSLIEDFKQKLVGINLDDPSIARTEFCFRDGGKLILPLNYGEVVDDEYYPFVEPLIKHAQSLNHFSLKNTIPLRIEISIMQPHKNILWHYDFHPHHKFSERIHFPIITDDKVDFYSKWFSDDKKYKFKMHPGSVYRINNRVLHSVKNNSDNFRCHVMIDFIKKDVWNWVLNNNFKEQFKIASASVKTKDDIFYYINPNTKDTIQEELSPTDLAQLDTLKKAY
jgi:hypothetical protein